MTTPIVEVTAVGPFGEEVARILGELRPGVRLARPVEDGPDGAAGEDDDEAPPAARVLAAWRPVPALARELDARSRAQGVPFLPVVAEPPQVVVGPVSVPGWPGCSACHAARALQHAARPAEQRALLAFYDAHPQAGPAGFLPALADLAAVRAAALLRRLERAPHEVAGRVWQINALTLRVASGTVVGVHGCPLCGLGRAEEERSHADLRAALAWMYDGEGFTPSSNGRHR